MIDPVSCAFYDVRLTRREHEESEHQFGRVPERDVQQPPMAGPARRARCSVARLIDSASGTTAAVATVNVHSEVGVVTAASATETGTRRSSHVNTFSSPHRPERSDVRTVSYARA